MTDLYYFDTDCLSAFLWIGGEQLLTRLYPDRIVLPGPVYRELIRVPFLQERVAELIRQKQIKIVRIPADSAEFSDYVRMTAAPDSGLRIIGKGEAAAIAMVRHRGGTVCSSNFNDVSEYATRYHFRHIGTAEILLEALHRCIISETNGNDIWDRMRHRRRRLPGLSFSEYLWATNSNRQETQNPTGRPAATVIARNRTVTAGNSYRTNRHRTTIALKQAVG